MCPGRTPTPRCRRRSGRLTRAPSCQISLANPLPIPHCGRRRNRPVARMLPRTQCGPAWQRPCSAACAKGVGHAVRSDYRPALCPEIRMLEAMYRALAVLHPFCRIVRVWGGRLRVRGAGRVRATMQAPEFPKAVAKNSPKRLKWNRALSPARADRRPTGRHASLSRGPQAPSRALCVHGCPVVTMPNYGWIGAVAAGVRTEEHAHLVKAQRASRCVLNCMTSGVSTGKLVGPG
jgi:hypothetical protein